MNEAELKKLEATIDIYGSYKRDLGEVLARQKFYKDDEIILDALRKYEFHLRNKANYTFNTILNIIEERIGEERYPESLRIPHPGLCR